MMKKFVFCVTFLLIAATAYAESITLTTYYPAPFGAYDRLRLVPRTPTGMTCNASAFGTLFVENANNTVQFCMDRGSGPAYGPLTGVWTQNNIDASNANVYLTDQTRDIFVGIGTTSPSAKLEVAGQVKITGGAPAAGKVLTSNGTGLASWETPAGGIPPGGIIMWSGTVASIPSGWALCDGTNGTPDLRDRFIYGISSGENPGATGGSNTYSLSVAQLPSHSHTASSASAGAHTHTITYGAWDHSSYPFKGVSGNPSPLVVNFPTDSSGSHSHTVSVDYTGSGATIDNRPAYYKLAFIMKL